MALQDEPQAVQARAAAVVETEKTYLALVTADTKGLSDEQLAERKIALARARKALGQAAAQLAEAI